METKMRNEPATFRTVYERGDTVRLIASADIDRYGEGPYEVRNDHGTTVTIRIIRDVTLPKANVDLHSNRPAYMEPGYAKCG